MAVATFFYGKIPAHTMMTRTGTKLAATEQVVLWRPLRLSKFTTQIFPKHFLCEKGACILKKMCYIEVGN